MTLARQIDRLAVPGHGGPGPGECATARTSPAFDPQLERLWWQEEAARYPLAEMAGWAERDLECHLTGDGLVDNLLRNKWEFVHGHAELKSYPWRLSLPFMGCNARCDFCAAWLMKGEFRMLDTLRAMLPAIRNAWELDLVGWGEPLLHPEFAEVIALLVREADPRARLALTTNGSLLDKWVDRLLDANIRHFAISLHASNSATHQDVMGFGPRVFDRVLAGVRKLVERSRDYDGVRIELVMVVMQQNIAEVPDFLALAEDLGVGHVNLKTLMPQAEPRLGLDYHRLPPYLHPSFEHHRLRARAAIAASPLSIKTDLATWDRPLFAPEWEPRLRDLPITPRETRFTYPEVPMDWTTAGCGQPVGAAGWDVDAPNPMGRSAPVHCPSPYTAFYINAPDRRTIPCVYMHTVPGHEPLHLRPDLTFEQVWNAPAMQAVRTSQHVGPLMPDCKKCPFYC
jgi:pyruvate-formate lyase-activating enzyme